MDKPSGNRLTLRRRIYNHRYFYLLALPGVTFYLLFKLLPMWGQLLAFFNYSPQKGIFGSEFVGFKNFTDFFKR